MSAGTLKALLPMLLLEGATAYSTYQAEIPNALNVKGCQGDLSGGVGHNRAGGGGPRNPFGLAFAAAGYKWTTALCQTDSDGDGHTNGQELGDPDCQWSKGQVPRFDKGITHPGFDCSITSCADGTQLAAKANTTLKGCAAYQAPSESSHDFAFSSYPVGPGTSYVQQSFTWPEAASSGVVKFEYLIQHPQVVHHMLLYRCPRDMSDIFGVPREKGSMVCVEVINAWAVGGSDFCVPENIAFVLEPSDPYFLLEIHYDNPTNLDGIKDDSGIRLHFVPFQGSALTEASVAFVGIRHPAITIPAGKANYRAQVTITAEKLGVLEGKAKIFGFIQHMHQIGRRQWLTAVDESSGDAEEVACNTDYDFDLQEAVLRDEVFELGSGSSLTLDCVYDSTERTEVTVGGDESENEMCLIVMFFTPAMKKAVFMPTEYTVMGSGEHVCGCIGDADDPHGNSSLSSQVRMLVFHGLLMGLAWGLVLPCGAAIALCWRSALRGGGWFTWHQNLQVMGVVLVLIAAGMAIFATEVHFDTTGGPHKLMGLLLIVLSLIQAMAGVLRPHKPDQGESETLVRTVWKMSHRVIALAALCIAVMQVYTGVGMLAMLEPSLTRWRSVMYGAFAASWIFAIAFGVMGYLKGGSKAYPSDIPGEGQNFEMAHDL